MFFNSTRNLLTFLKKMELKDKSLLDLGTGSGILALYAASKGAIVTASDISQQAADNSVYNSKKNHLGINIIQSDLFDHIKHLKYEIIAINPPYYPKNPEKESDYAWYCGDGFEYYHKLFKQILAYLNPDSLAILSLADTCDINKIQHIAGIYSSHLELVEQKNYLWEKQFIFRIVKK
jgi:release factor glutamine methyltransferase